jgi:hypothetical protein
MILSGVTAAFVDIVLISRKCVISPKANDALPPLLDLEGARIYYGSDIRVKLFAPSKIVLDFIDGSVT